MICKMNTKFITALAVCAMVFAGFGAVFVAQDNDAVETPAVTYDYANGEDGELYAILTFDVAKFLGHAPGMDDVINFVDDVFDKYSKDALVKVTYGYELSGKTVDKIFPAYLLDYIDVDAKKIIIPAVSKADTDLIETIDGYKAVAADEKGYTLSFKYSEAIIDVAVDVGTAVAMTPEEQAAVEASIALLTEQVAELQADVAAKEAMITELQAQVAELQADIVAKEAKIAELEEYIEELEEGSGEVIKKLKAQVADLEAQVEADKKAIADKDAKIADLEKQLAEKKDGDATIAWCVAAVGIIAAIVLAGFILIVFNKANKEGRRLL